ncbi:MAG: hypothetical protein ACLPVW_15610 [Terriglobales bacterium]
MEQAESRKTFTHGFVLTEPELRRIVDSISEQFGKLSSEHKPDISYRMTFKNGVIADTGSLDDVLSQENAGSGLILRLSIKAVLQTKPTETVVTMEFLNADAEDEPGYTSVRALVRGLSRDWVFVTSTMLDERIAKVKRFAFNQLSGKGPSRTLFRLSAPVLALFGALLAALLPFRSPSPSLVLEQARKSGEIRDPIDAIIMAERLRYNAAQPASALGKAALAVGGVLLLFLLVLGFIARYYPIYNFCWGDYLDVFQRKESRRKFILVVVVLGVLISCIGGILANIVHHG